MESIIITPKSKKSIPFLKHLLSSLDDVQSVKVLKQPQSRIAKNFEIGLKEAKSIADGRKKGKSLKSLLNGE
jgi:hypothetical protein